MAMIASLGIIFSGIADTVWAPARAPFSSYTCDDRALARPVAQVSHTHRADYTRRDLSISHPCTKYYALDHTFRLSSYATQKINTNKYKKQLNKLKNEVGMVGPKSTQTRVVGIIMDEMHPYTKLDVGMHLIYYYPYYSCLCTSWSYHPYLILQFI